MDHKVTYTPQRSAPLHRPALAALWTGAKQRCPACSTGRIFRAYLKVNEHCPDCGEALHHHRADDAPPYFTILIVGHIVIPAMLELERASAPPLWLHAAIWLPLTLLLCLALLPVTKGALVALQWALRMHGFDQAPPPAAAKLRGDG